MKSFHSPFLIPNISFQILYFLLDIKLQHKQAIQEHKQGGIETGHGHTQVFQDGLGLHHVRHYTLQHRDVCPPAYVRTLPAGRIHSTAA